MLVSRALSRTGAALLTIINPRDRVSPYHLIEALFHGEIETGSRAIRLPTVYSFLSVPEQNARYPHRCFRHLTIVREDQIETE